MKTIIFICASLISLNLAWSHEGHDKTPGAIAAVHGGMVEGKGHIYLELVSNSDEVKIYPFDHDQKPIPLSEIKKINGKMSFPRKN